MQVVDVRHVNGVLEHRPVTALKLDLAIHRPPPEHEQGHYVQHMTAQISTPKTDVATAAAVYSSRSGANATVHK